VENFTVAMLATSHDHAIYMTTAGPALLNLLLLKMTLGTKHNAFWVNWVCECIESVILCPLKVDAHDYLTDLFIKDW
jgi:hypothetical protein